MGSLNKSQFAIDFLAYIYAKRTMLRKRENAVENSQNYERTLLRGGARCRDSENDVVTTFKHMCLGCAYSKLCCLVSISVQQLKNHCVCICMCVFVYVYVYGVKLNSIYKR